MAVSTTISAINPIKISPMYIGTPLVIKNIITTVTITNAIITFARLAVFLAVLTPCAKSPSLSASIIF